MKEPNEHQKIQAGVTAQEIPTAERARIAFLKSLGKRIDTGANEGGADEAARFLACMDRASMSGPFDANRVIYEAKCQDISAKRAIELMTRWLEVNMRLNRVISIPTIMDLPQFLRMS